MTLGFGCHDGLRNHRGQFIDVSTWPAWLPSSGWIRIFAVRCTAHFVDKSRQLQQVHVHFPEEFILFESDFTHTQGGIYFVSCTFRYLHFSSKCNFYPSFFLFCRHVRCVRRRRRKQGQPSFVWPRAIHFCFIHRRQLDDLTFCKGGPCVDSSINWKFQNFFGIIYFNDVEVVACATSH